MNQYRTVSQIIEPEYVIEGAGVLLRRSIAPRVTNAFDPFLLFDHFAFNDPIEGPIRGFPMHPHRGIETVTYMLEGSTQHRDSLGNSGLIGPGDVQWMTSGRGILHEEMPRRGPSGNIYGFQLWVNLPARLKMSAPRYQEVNAQSIPEYEKQGVKLRVVAGTVEGVTGPVTEIAASPLYLEARLAKDTEFIQPVPAEHTVLAYVFEGEGVFGDQDGRGRAHDRVRRRRPHPRAHREQSRALHVDHGQAHQRTYRALRPVRNEHREEIQQALAELRNGTFIKDEPA